jgi:hypothetical protein
MSIWRECFSYWPLKSAHPALNLTLIIAWSLIYLLLLLDHFDRFLCGNGNCLRRNSTQFVAWSYVSPVFGVEVFKVVKRSSLLVPSFDCLHIPGTLLKTSSFEMTASEFGLWSLTTIVVINSDHCPRFSLFSSAACIRS